MRHIAGNLPNCHGAYFLYVMERELVQFSSNRAIRTYPIYRLQVPPQTVDCIHPIKKFDWTRFGQPSKVSREAKSERDFGPLEPSCFQGRLP
jgi:hypothetical protein